MTANVGARRPRKLKTLRPVNVPEAIYFVTAPTRRRDSLLVADRAGAVVEAFKLLRDKGLAWVVAFVVMPDHIHAVIAPRMESQIGDAMKYFKRVAGNVIRQLGREGRVWETRFYDRVMRDADELRAAVEYVHANPVRPGLCSEPADWPWSTAATFECWDFSAGSPPLTIIAGCVQPGPPRSSDNRPVRVASTSVNIPAY